MEAAQSIRAAVARVTDLRQACQAQPALGLAIGEVKRVQSRRFAGSYADLLRGGPYRDAAAFFLEELYNDKDYAERDAQFARIAGAVQRLFPAHVASTAVSLADLHALTEELDFAMATEWVRQPDSVAQARRYVECWRTVGRRADRQAQLRIVLAIGAEMTRLTRMPGLRLMLKMMRGPAGAAGLSSLQHFLERGFDTFAGMARVGGRAESFLALIGDREAKLIAALFDEDLVASETKLAALLGQAR